MFAWFARDLACVLAVAAALLFPHAGRAAPVVSGAQVTFSGEIGRADSTTDIAAKPGVRMGLELVPQGSKAGEPLALDVQVLRPGTQPLPPPISFQVAAATGSPVLCAYEFAYGWEAVPGTWTMKVFYDGKELASQDFTVAEAPQDAAASQATEPTPPVAALPETKPAETAPTADKPSAAPQPAQEKEPAQKPLAEKSPGQKTPAKDNPAKKTPIKGKPSQQRFVLVSGVYSQEVRAQWVTALLKDRGVKARVKKNAGTAKPTWSVVVGWKDTRQQALDAKRKLSAKVGEIQIVPMTSDELEKGLARP